MTKHVEAPAVALKSVPAAPAPSAENSQKTEEAPKPARVWKFKNAGEAFYTAPLPSGKMEAFPPGYVIETSDHRWAALIENHIARYTSEIKKIN